MPLRIDARSFGGQESGDRAEFAVTFDRIHRDAAGSIIRRDQNFTGMIERQMARRGAFGRETVQFRQGARFTIDGKACDRTIAMSCFAYGI